MCDLSVVNLHNRVDELKAACRKLESPSSRVTSSRLSNGEINK